MTRKIKEYDVLKVMAIILVVLSHSVYYNITSNYGGIAYQQYVTDGMALNVYKIFSKIVEIIYYFHMPLFMALSGTFFSIQVKNNRWNDIKELIDNKFRRLIMPFLIFTLLYTLPLKYASNYYEGIPFWKALVGQLFLLGNSHLWYLYALFAIFILGFYVLKKKTSFYVYAILYVLHVSSYLIKITLVSAPLQFLFWFALGFLFETNRETYNKFLDKNKWITYILILLFIFMVVFNFYLKSNYKLLSRLVIDILAIIGSTICYNMSYILSKQRSIVANSMFNLILINGLGIYIFSDTLNYFILRIVYIISDNFMFMPVGIISLIILRFLGTLFGGLGLTLLFKKIFKKYSWLVN